MRERSSADVTPALSNWARSCPRQVAIRRPINHPGRLTSYCDPHRRLEDSPGRSALKPTTAKLESKQASRSGARSPRASACVGALLELLRELLAQSARTDTGLGAGSHLVSLSLRCRHVLIRGLAGPAHKCRPRILTRHLCRGGGDALAQKISAKQVWLSAASLHMCSRSLAVIGTEPKPFLHQQ